MIVMLYIPRKHLTGNRVPHILCLLSVVVVSQHCPPAAEVAYHNMILTIVHHIFGQKI